MESEIKSLILHETFTHTKVLIPYISFKDTYLLSISHQLFEGLVLAIPSKTTCKGVHF